MFHWDLNASGMPYIYFPMHCNRDEILFQSCLCFIRKIIRKFYKRRCEWENVIDEKCKTTPQKIMFSIRNFFRVEICIRNFHLFSAILMMGGKKATFKISSGNFYKRSN